MKVSSVSAATITEQTALRQLVRQAADESVCAENLRGQITLTSYLMQLLSAGPRVLRYDDQLILR
jgi:hypothetical protein